MLCTDFVGLLTQVLLVVPETWAGYQLYPDGWVYLMGAANTVSYNAELLLALLLTFNRLCIFAAPSLDRVFFTRPRIFVWVWPAPLIVYSK